MSREGHGESQGTLNIRKSYHLSMEMKSKAEEMVSFMKNVLIVTERVGGGS